MRASASCAETISAFASAACAVAPAASALASASASALPRFIQKVTMATREPPAAISAPQVSTSCIASPLIGARRAPPEDARHLLDGAPTEISGDDDAGPGADVTGDRVSRAQSQDFVVDYHFPDVDHHRQRRERAYHRSPPAPLLRDDDRGGLRAGGNLSLDLLHGKIDGELVLRIRRRKLRFVGLDNRIEHWSREDAEKPLQHGSGPVFVEEALEIRDLGLDRLARIGAKFQQPATQTLGHRDAQDKGCKNEEHVHLSSPFGLTSVGKHFHDITQRHRITVVPIEVLTGSAILKALL